MATPETELLIDGERVGGTGHGLAVENPFDESTVATVAVAGPDQLDAAIAAATGAQQVWERTAALERGEMLHEVATRMRAMTEELAELMTLEGGKPLLENRDEIGWTAAAFDYYAEIGRDSAGRVIPPIESSQLALVVKDPVGPVACIVPWNYPLLLLAWKLAPALAAGNATVSKPSEITPLSTLALAPCFEHLPAGVVNLIAGAGDIGAGLVADERIACVAFTGSVETGKKIAAKCAERVARVNLEMGGKDPFIVCSDVAAEIEVAARGGAWAAFLNAGQVCTSAERFYVHDDVFDDYLAAFAEHTRSLVVGDPMDASTDVGPMVSAPQRQKVADQVEAALWRLAPSSFSAATPPGTSTATSTRRRCSPGRGPRRRCSPRRPSARSRRSSAFVRSTRRSSSRTRPASASERTSTRATCRRSCAACAS